MIPSTVRIFVCTQPQDMRKGFDGLARVAREVLGEDPQSGAVFCFVNKRGNRVKALWFESSGYCLLYKRGHRVRFELPKAPGTSVRIDGRGLSQLLAGIAKPRK